MALITGRTSAFVAAPLASTVSAGSVIPLFKRLVNRLRRPSRSVWLVVTFIETVRPDLIVLLTLMYWALMTTWPASICEGAVPILPFWAKDFVLRRVTKLPSGTDGNAFSLKKPICRCVQPSCAEGE